MLLPLLALGIAQAVGPVLPAGVNPPYQKSFIVVQQAMQKGEFARAQSILAKLPRASLTINWDEKKLDPAFKEVVAEAGNGAIREWTENLSNLKITRAPRADILVTFVNRLPANADSAGPAGAVFFVSDMSGEPRLEVIISRLRGPNAVPATMLDIRNELLFGIGYFLGLERTPTVGSAMDRTDLNYVIEHRVSQANKRLVLESLAAVEALKALAAKKVRVTPSVPIAFSEPAGFTFGEKTQGEVVETTISVTNRGNAPLSLRVVPDCSCFLVQHSPTVAPGGTAIVKVSIRTAEFPGPFDKAVFIYTNDPDASSRRIPFRMHVEPRYRFLQPVPRRVLQVGDDGLKTELFLTYGSKSPFQVKAVRIDGVSAIAQADPWSGQLADPEMKEPAKQRSGYKISILGGPSVPPGRIPMSVVVETDDPVFPVMRYTLYVQKGIIALPDNIYMGIVQQKPMTFPATVSRPGKPFRIVSARSDNPHFKVKLEKKSGADEYKLAIDFDGKADPGDISAVITVTTDDSSQKEVAISLRGIVR